jgi:hypothetical protein
MGEIHWEQARIDQQVRELQQQRQQRQQGKAQQVRCAACVQMGTVAGAVVVV